MRPEIRDTLITEGLDLETDQSKHINCPFCAANHEQSMWVLRTEVGLYYICYRAKCGAEGFISSVGATSRSTSHKKFRPKQFTGELENLPEDVVALLEANYWIPCWAANANGWKFAPEHKRLYMPIFDYRGYTEQVGEMTKQLYPNPSWKGPKAIVYWATETNKLHFPIQDMTYGVPLVVVEDHLSAVRCVMAEYRSAALLGSSMSEKQALQLSRISKDIIIALDPDAIEKAFKMRKRYGLMFRSCVVAQLSDDPKDLPPLKLQRELEEFLPNNNNNKEVKNGGNGRNSVDGGGTYCSSVEK